MRAGGDGQASEVTMSTMRVSFPGGKRADAVYGGFTIRTDQPRRHGGDESAPQPFDVFLASIATCAGFFAKAYCDARQIPTDGLALEMTVERDHERHRVARLALEISLPPGFPEKHREGIVRAADQCSVKKHILEPPAIEVSTRVHAAAAAHGEPS